MRPLLLALAACSVVLAIESAATEPNQSTMRWWRHVQVLADDAMRGRDTGSPEHRRAQLYVAQQLQRSGVNAAGSDGFLQSVAIRQMRLDAQSSTATITRGGQTTALRWLQQIVLQPMTDMPSNVTGELVFAGSDGGASVGTAGKIVVRLNPVRLVAGADQPAQPADAAAIIGIDSSDGPEPSRWPAQRADVMVLADAAFPALPPAGAPTLRFNPQFADLLLTGSGHTYRQLLDLAAAGRPVPSFAIAASVQIAPVFQTAELTSDNVIGELPGSDAALARELIVLSAHVDGYGVGEPWNGDDIYNGAFDDAAYVATLLDFAEALRESGTRLRRSLLFVLVTGEEKGLLGSRYFTRHLTVPRERLVANVNLDQLRPVFPLHTLTMHALDDSTLGDTARQIGGAMNIRIQADPEPDRQLARRSDNFSFVEIGVPATGFVFGYQPGTADEAAYRRWYADRYHTPKDDLGQPWVPDAAAKFNEFFARFVTALANADNGPRWTTGYTASDTK